ncbi:MAG: hypothetical protein MJZ66_05695 [Bacteroidales bacterium]|nr:hypothetical protein [Bacteroidales bacterium]
MIKPTLRILGYFAILDKFPIRELGFQTIFANHRINYRGFLPVNIGNIVGAKVNQPQRMNVINVTHIMILGVSIQSWKRVVHIIAMRRHYPHLVSIGIAVGMMLNTQRIMYIILLENGNKLVEISLVLIKELSLFFYNIPGGT